MTTISTDIPAEPVSTDKTKNTLNVKPKTIHQNNVFWRRNLKDEVILLIRKALENGNLSVSKMVEIMQSNKYQENRNMGFYNNLLESWIKSLGLGFLVHYHDLQEWKHSPCDNNLSASLELFENTVIEQGKSEQFLLEWKSSPYPYDLCRFIDWQEDKKKNVLVENNECEEVEPNE